ncbi:MAG: hypothetical protein IKZ51_00415 [Bacteroidales bacterium]|nr:hypothetical protein [Bacteroidales bacterium]
MKKALLVFLLLLYGASLLHGQVADSTSWKGQGEVAIASAQGMLYSGALTAAAGGGLMLLAVAPWRTPPEPEEAYFNENWVPIVVYLLGGTAVISGLAFMLASVPVFIAGGTIKRCDGPWKEARYDKRGLGLILEGGYFAPDVIQMRTELGYHFSSHSFLGLGVAPGFYWAESHRANTTHFSLPVYADFRWSFCNNLLSPYLGLSAGMEMLDDPFSPYLEAELGGRIRSDKNSTRSFWMGISGEAAGGYIRAGLKMGYSF